MNAKHKAFVEQYLKCFNATEAYQQVYAPADRATAGANGFRLLKNAEIAQAIKERLEETAMLASEVLMLLAAHARSDITDLLGENHEIDLDKARKAKKTRHIKKLTQRKTVRTKDDSTIEEVVTSVEMYSALDALDKLGRYHGLFSEKEPDQPVEQSQVVIYIPDNGRT